MLTLAGASCSTLGPARGSVMVVVDTNVTPGRDFDTLRIRVENDAASEIAYHYAWDDAAQRATVVDGGFLPLTINVQNANDELTERQVSVTAWKGGHPVFSRDAHLVLPLKGTKTLRMPVEALCFPEVAEASARALLWREADWAVSCDRGRTCFAGGCVDAHVATARLEEYEPTAVFGGSPRAAVGGQCVDALGCFTRRGRNDGSLDESKLAQVVQPVSALGKCVLNVELLNGDDDIVIGVEMHDRLGACGANGCVVLLDRVSDPTQEVGWSAVGGRVALPKAVCDRVLRVFVRVSPDGLCPLKNATRPLCGEVSSLGEQARALLANRSGESLVLEGGAQGGIVCAAFTPSRELCPSAGAGCGEVYVSDDRCALPLFPPSRYAQCRGVGETTSCTSDDTQGMRFIPGGTFTMGASPMEVETYKAYAEELPQHPVAVRDFWLDTTEVTVDAYAACVGAGKCTPPAIYSSCNSSKPGRGKHPVTCVSWYQANAYCAWKGKRLPTEEEWEYAARGGSKQYVFPWGREPPSDARVCWSGVSPRIEGSCEVGSFSPAGDSIHGVKDLIGNVTEWTASAYAGTYDSLRMPGQRVVRGGSFNIQDPNRMRAAARPRDDAYRQSFDFGFRCSR